MTTLLASYIYLSLDLTHNCYGH